MQIIACWRAALNGSEACSLIVMTLEYLRYRGMYNLHRCVIRCVNFGLRLITRRIASGHQDDLSRLRKWIVQEVQILLDSSLFIKKRRTCKLGGGYEQVLSPLINSPLLPPTPFHKTSSLSLFVLACKLKC